MWCYILIHIEVRRRHVDELLEEGEKEGGG